MQAITDTSMNETMLTITEHGRVIHRIFLDDACQSVDLMASNLAHAFADCDTTLAQAFK